MFYLAALMKVPDGGPNTAFYDAWSNYLSPMPRVYLSMIETIMHGIAEIFFDLGNAVLTAWTKVWDLADFSGIFVANTHGDITGYNLGQYVPIFATIGFVVFAIMMYISLFMFTLTNGEKGKEWPKGIIIIFMVLGIMPWLITGGTAISKSANDTFLPKDNNVLVQVWKNNSVDLEKVADKNFDVKVEDLKNYSPIKDGSDPAIVHAPFFAKVMDEDETKKISGENKIDAQKVFTKKRGVDDQSEDLDKGVWFTGGIFNEIYPMIKVNWMGIIGAEITFSIVGFLAIIELVVRLYRIAYYTITILVFAFRDLKGEKAMQIMHLIEGSFIGMALMPLNVVLFFAFIQWSMTKLESMGLSTMPFTILSIGIMIGGAKGLFGGFSLIDDWTGVPTGHGNTAQSLIAGGMAAGAVGNMAKSAGNTAKGGLNATKALVDKASAASGKISDKVAEKANDMALKHKAKSMQQPLNKSTNGDDANKPDGSGSKNEGGTKTDTDENNPQSSERAGSSENNDQAGQDSAGQSGSDAPMAPPNPAGPQSSESQGDVSGTGETNSDNSSMNKIPDTSKTSGSKDDTGTVHVPMNAGSSKGQNSAGNNSEAKTGMAPINTPSSVNSSGSRTGDNSPKMTTDDSNYQDLEKNMPPLPTQAELDEMMPPIELY